MAGVTKDLLRPADLAPHLGVTTGRVYQLIRAGAIPATRLGGAIRIPREAWERWLGQQRDRALGIPEPAAEKEKDGGIVEAEAAQDPLPSHPE